MEDIIQFLIIIGALFIGFVAQNKKKKRQTDEEAFPPILDYEEEEEEEMKPEIQMETLIPSVSQTASMYTAKDYYTPVSVQKKPTQPSTSVTKKRPLPTGFSCVLPKKRVKPLFTRKYLPENINNKTV